MKLQKITPKGGQSGVPYAYLKTHVSQIYVHNEQELKTVIDAAAKRAKILLKSLVRVDRR